MIRTRLAMPRDRQVVVDLARMDVAETLPHLDFDEEITGRTFDNAIAQAHPTIFVAEIDGEVIGFLMGVLETYAFTSGVFVVQEVLYVRPDRRGPRAAVLLLDEFRRWGEAVNARELIYGITNGRKTGAFERFIGRFTRAEYAGKFFKEARG